MNSHEIANEIEKKRTELYDLYSKKKELQAKYSTQTDALAQKAQSLKEQLERLPKPHLSPLYTILAIAYVVLLVLSEVLVMKYDVSHTVEGILIIVLIIAFIVTLIVRKKKKKNLNAPYEKKRDEINAQIARANDEIERIEDSDPELREVNRKIRSLLSEKGKLQDMLDQAKLNEKIGTNTLLIYADNTQKHRLIGLDQGRGRVADWQDGHIIVDGVDRGLALSPFNIISLSPGFHSVSLRFESSINRFETSPVQFSLNNNHAFVTITGPTLLDDNIYSKKHDDLKSFLQKIKKSETEFNRIIASI